MSELKTNKTVIRSVAVAFGVLIGAGVLGTTVAVPTAEAGCKSQVTSRLIWAKKRDAGDRRARRNWQNKARAKYGWRYRKWGKAASKSYSRGYNVGSAWKWRIRARGRPCK